MQVFVVEIDGRGIAAFGAEDGLEAKAIAEEMGFRSDLIVLENEGKPLWGRLIGDTRPRGIARGRDSLEAGLPLL